MSKSLAIVYRPTASLRPFAKNTRTHSKAQVEQIAASIREFGFTNPILLREDGESIGAGHGRWAAAKIVGLAEVPTIVLPGLSDAQWRAYIIADNKLALNAGWDEPALKAELEALLDDGFDLSLTGFDETELDDLLRGELLDLSGGEGEGTSGVKDVYLAIGKKKVPMTEVETTGMEKLLADYGAQSGATYGFASWLLENIRGA